MVSVPVSLQTEIYGLNEFCIFGLQFPYSTLPFATKILSPLQFHAFSIANSQQRKSMLSLFVPHKRSRGAIILWLPGCEIILYGQFNNIHTFLFWCCDKYQAEVLRLYFKTQYVMGNLLIEVSTFRSKSTVSQKISSLSTCKSTFNDT